MTSEEIETCSICYCELDIDNKIMLKCNHIYCYTCIYDWFKNTLQTTTIKYSMSTVKLRECPYCRTPGDILPYKEGFPNIQDININIKVAKCDDSICNAKAIYNYSETLKVFTKCKNHKWKNK